MGRPRREPGQSQPLTPGPLPGYPRDDLLCRHRGVSWDISTAKRRGMRLYSIQPLAVYDLLCHEGQFHSRPLAYPNSNLSYYRDDFAFVLAYEWLMTKMTALGLPRPAPMSTRSGRSFSGMGWRGQNRTCAAVV